MVFLGGGGSYQVLHAQVLLHFSRQMSLRGDSFRNIQQYVPANWIRPIYLLTGSARLPGTQYYVAHILT